MNRGSTLWALTILASLAAIAALCGCADERSLQPTPVTYRLYVGMAPSEGTDTHILVFDCESDSIVDSVYGQGWETGFYNLTAGPSPGMLIVVNYGIHKVLDTRSNSFVASLESTFSGIAFFPEYGRFVGGGADRLVVFDDTTYAIRHTYEREMGNCKRLGNSTRVIAQTHLNISPSPPGAMIIYDALTEEIIDSFVVDPLENGSGFTFESYFDKIDISPDGTRLYGFGHDASCPGVIGFDIIHKTTIFKHPAPTRDAQGNCTVSPDGHEAWITWGGPDPFGGLYPQSIHILDAISGQLIDTIDVSGTALGQDYFAGPVQVQFLPAESKAYVSALYFGQRGWLLVIDTETREVMKVLTRPSARFSGRIAIGPAP